MAVNVMNKIVQIKDRQVLIKTIIYVQLTEMGILLPENDLNVLSLFVLNTNKQEVIQKALDKGFVKSWQSGENTVSKLVKLELLQKDGIKKRKVSPNLMSFIDDDFIAATVKIHNLNINELQSYKFDEVIDKVCEKKKLNPELMKSFSDFIFTQTKKEMGEFKNLRIYLRGFLSFFYGKKRLIEFKEKVLKKIEGASEKKTLAFLERQSPEQLLQTRDKVDALLDVYDIYIEDKNTTKKAFREEKYGIKTEV